MLDAFDFFILVMVVSDIAADFHTGVTDVVHGIFWTLVGRPIGAFIFGYLADRFGRRPILMIDVLLFALFEFGSAFAPNLGVLLVMRFLFCIAMGGKWGIGFVAVLISLVIGFGVEWKGIAMGTMSVDH
jgi:SHS family lactate transporter-like MFS transporter